MGAGSVPTHRKTSGALYHRLPAGNMPRPGKFHARGAFSHDRPDAITPCNASGRDIPVLFLKQTKPSVHIAVGHLEHARRAASALVTDSLAMRRRAAVILVPTEGAVAALAFAGAFRLAAHRVRRGAEG